MSSSSVSRNSGVRERKGKNSSVVPRRYSSAEAQKIVDEAWEFALKDAFKRIWEHPFTRELEAGTLPIEIVRGFICNWYTAAQEINAASCVRILFQPPTLQSDTRP